MDILVEIERRREACIATGMAMEPTIYAGRKQMSLIHDSVGPLVEDPALRNLPTVTKLLGMHLVRVDMDDYLRVA